MVNIQWQTLIDTEKGKRAQELTNQAFSKFFSLGIKRIQDECNILARKYGEKWSMTPENLIQDFGPSNIPCKIGITQLEKKFSFLEPSEIIFDFSNLTNIAPASQCFLDPGTNRISLITIYLGNWVLQHGSLTWPGFTSTFDEIIFHELAHACGDVDRLPISKTAYIMTGIVDGIIRHNWIISKSISNLLG